MIARTLKFVAERHPEGHLAYPLEMRGVAMGQGYSFEEALADANWRIGEIEICDIPVTVR